MATGTGWRTEESDWDAFIRWLPDYVRMEFAQESSDARYPDMYVAIETSERHAAAYEKEFRRQGAQKSLEELRAIGQRDAVAEVLDRIVNPEAAPQRSVFAWGSAWVEQVTGKWRQMEVALANLTFGGTGALHPVGLQGDEPATNAESQGSLGLAPTGSGVDLIVQAQPVAAQDGKRFYRVTVTLSLEERFGDYSGVAIALTTDDGVAQQQQTDALGRATFAPIPAEQLSTMRAQINLSDTESD